MIENEKIICAIEKRTYFTETLKKKNLVVLDVETSKIGSNIVVLGYYIVGEPFIHQLIFPEPVDPLRLRDTKFFFDNILKYDYKIICYNANFESKLFQIPIENFVETQSIQYLSKEKAISIKLLEMGSSRDLPIWIPENYLRYAWRNLGCIMKTTILAMGIHSFNVPNIYSIYNTQIENTIAKWIETPVHNDGLDEKVLDCIEIEFKFSDFIEETNLIFIDIQSVENNPNIAVFSYYKAGEKNIKQKIFPQLLNSTELMNTDFFRNNFDFFGNFIVCYTKEDVLNHFDIDPRRIIETIPINHIPIDKSITLDLLSHGKSNTLEWERENYQKFSYRSLVNLIKIIILLAGNNSFNHSNIKNLYKKDFEREIRAFSSQNDKEEAK